MLAVDKSARWFDRNVAGKMETMFGGISKFGNYTYQTQNELVSRISWTEGWERWAAVIKIPRAVKTGFDVFIKRCLVPCTAAFIDN